MFRKNAKAYYKDGWMCYVNGDFGGAIAAFSETIRINPQFVEGYVSRGIVRYNIGEIDGERSDLFEAARLQLEMPSPSMEFHILLQGVFAHYTPQNAEIYVYRGRARFHVIDDRDGAIADFNIAVRLSPKYADAYYERAYAYMYTDSIGYEGAIPDFTMAISCNPQYAEAYRFRGTCHHMIGNLRDAISDYTAAMQLNPKGNLYGMRGGARYHIGDFDGAFADYNIALSLNSGDHGAYRGRGEVRRAKEDFEGAIADFNTSLNLDPSNPFVYRERGITRRIKGDLDGAITDFNMALHLNPQMLEVYCDLGMIWTIKGNASNAILSYQHYLVPRHSGE